MKNAKHYKIDFAVYDYGVWSDFPWHALSLKEIRLIKEHVEMCYEFERDKRGLIEIDFCEDDENLPFD